MIKEYYPRTDSSLANSITMCVRAWVDEGVESFHTEEKEKPIATFIGTICGSDVLIGEITENLQLRLQELNKDYAESYWVPIIFYKNTSIVKYIREDTEAYLRLYKIIMDSYGFNDNTGAILENGFRVRIKDIVRSIRIINYYNDNECSNIADNLSSLHEFSYFKQDEYIHCLKTIVDCTNPVEEKATLSTIDEAPNNMDYSEIINNLAYNLLGESYTDMSFSTEILQMQMQNMVEEPQLYAKYLSSAYSKKKSMHNKKRFPKLNEEYGILTRGVGPEFPQNPYQGQCFYNTKYNMLFVYIRINGYWRFILKII